MDERAEKLKARVQSLTQAIKWDQVEISHLNSNIELLMVEIRDIQENQCGHSWSQEKKETTRQATCNYYGIGTLVKIIGTKKCEICGKVEARLIESHEEGVD